MTSGHGHRRVRIPEPLRGLAKAARRQRWTITMSGSGHLLWRSPAGTTITTSGTPGDSRELPNVRARLRNAGLKLNR